MPGSQTRTRAEVLGSGTEPHARYWSQVRDRRPHPFRAQEFRVGACSRARGRDPQRGGRSQLHKPQSKSGALLARTGLFVPGSRVKGDCLPRSPSRYQTGSWWGAREEALLSFVVETGSIQEAGAKKRLRGSGSAERRKRYPPKSIKNILQRIRFASVK